jgi:hypothetical protein
MGQVTVSAGFLAIGLGGFENLFPDPPGMAVFEVMGKLFSDDDVGADASVKKIIGKAAQQLLQKRREEAQVGEDFRADLEMDPHSPRQGF